MLIIIFFQIIITLYSINPLTSKANKFFFQNFFIEIYMLNYPSFSHLPIFFSYSLLVFTHARVKKQVYLSPFCPIFTHTLFHFQIIFCPIFSPLSTSFFNFDPVPFWFFWFSLWYYKYFVSSFSLRASRFVNIGWCERVVAKNICFYVWLSKNCTVKNLGRKFPFSLGISRFYGLKYKLSNSWNDNDFCCLSTWNGQFIAHFM